MLNRRHLFRALSSVALAPLVKWLPKECDKGFDANASQLLTHDGWKPYHELKFYPHDWAHPHSPAESIEELHNLMNKIIAAQVPPVPEEKT